MAMRVIVRRQIQFFSSVRVPEGYRHLSSFHSDDLKATVHQLGHEQTGARIVHFQNEDKENVFAAVVKTFAANDKGCPHILEHLTCCGSEKYPIRDPFFNMIKRSVNTYMNAWTGDDFTCYPFSSVNHKDWNNLYSVYLDMVFKPQLKELDFLQEGWRFELDAAGNRSFKGVVLNEMKGTEQDADRQLQRHINRQLFGGTPYVYDTGGASREIVNLGYSELLQMHRHYYHPSNMSFYYYGNRPIEDRLTDLHRNYLSKYTNQGNKYSHRQIIIPDKPQHNFCTIECPTAESTTISLQWYLGNLQTIPLVDKMCLKMLGYVLFDKNNALAYESFVESGLAETLGYCGYNDSKLTTFVVTLKGIDPNYECSQFQSSCRGILQLLSEQGVDQQRIDQFCHQFEVSILTPRQNNGIRYLEEFLYHINHRSNIEDYLTPRAHISKAKAVMESKTGLNTLIQKYFLNNQHFVIVKQVPKEEHKKDTSTVENEIQSNMVVTDEVILMRQKELQARQKEAQDVSVLPCLQLSDLYCPERRVFRQLLSRRVQGRQYRQYHVPIVEDIDFYRIIFTFKTVSKEFLEGLSLWIYSINKGISTGSLGYKELSARISQVAGSFSVAPGVGVKDEMNIIFETSCLKKNREELFRLIEEIIHSPRFELDNTLNVYRSYSNQVTESLTQMPMNECLDEGASQLSLVGSLYNSFQRAKQGLVLARSKKIEKLYQVSNWLLKCPKISLIVHSNQVSDTVPPFIDRLLALPCDQMTPFVFNQFLLDKSVLHNYNVNFCSQQYLGPSYLSSEHAYLSLLLEILEQKYLHPEIREKGGAYGAKALYKPNQIISLYSYMDPHAEETFQVFENSIRDMLTIDKIPAEELLQTKLKQFAVVDRVRIPQEEAVEQIVRNYTSQQWGLFRDHLREATFAQMVQAGRKYFTTRRSRVIFGKKTPTGFVEEKLKNFL